MNVLKEITALKRLETMKSRIGGQKPRRRLVATGVYGPSGDGAPFGTILAGGGSGGAEPRYVRGSAGK